MRTSPVITNLCTTPEGVCVEKTPDHHLSYEDGFLYLVFRHLFCCQLLHSTVNFALVFVMAVSLCFLAVSRSYLNALTALRLLLPDCHTTVVVTFKSMLPSCWTCPLTTNLCTAPDGVRVEKHLITIFRMRTDIYQFPV